MSNNFFHILCSEIYKTIKNPLRITNLIDKKKRLGLVRSYDSINRVRDWEKQGIFQTKVYDTYEEYLKHQKLKLERIINKNEKIDIDNYDKTYRKHLRDRLQSHINVKGTSVLCLAARVGTEVKAFLDLGCFAIGIDLNPGVENKYVVVGDFHNVQYADQSLDVVFTNSFDHVFYPEKILQEIQRVLKPQGRFISDFAAGNNTQGTYESFSWSNIEDLITLVEKHGFKLIHQENIDYPFKNGSFVIFEKLN